MITVSVRIVPGLLVACILMFDLIIPRGTQALNRAHDIKILTENERIMLALRLEERPKYSLKPLNGKQLMLSIHDTSNSPELEKEIAEETYLELEKEGSDDMNLRITPDKPFNRIDSSWLADEKLLYIDIGLTSKTEEDDGIEASEKNAPVLKDIRFGFKDDATRMVMGLHENPLWEMSYLNDNDIVVKLEAVTEKYKEMEYGPIKRLKRVLVLGKGDDNRIDISLQLESKLNRVNIFWVEVGNRLVMDLFDEPCEIDEKMLKEGHQDDNSPSQEEANDEAEEEIRNIVRLKMPQRPKADPAKSSDKVNSSSLTVDEQITIEPKLDYLSPSGTDLKVSVQDLSPGEAFLFGRIQQAMEINDHEKGISLINRFLEEYPNSTLTEDICFLRGDFYYYLWQKGDMEISEKVISAYQYAIERFGNADTVPLAYIKIAQVSSGMENSYSAIGYLGLVLAKNESPFLPLAYLTRGKIFLQMEQPEKAITDFQMLLNNYPDSKYATEAGFWIANYYHSMGLYEEAEEKLDQVTASNPEIYLDYPEYLLLSAKNYLYLKQYDLARDYLFKAVNIGHQSESIDLLLSRIGDTYHNEEDEKEAEKYYRMVIDYYPDSEGSAISKLRLADYFSDITILEDLSDDNVDEPIVDLALLEKGYQLYEQKQYSLVMESLQELISKPVQTETRKEAKLLYLSAAEKEMEQLYREGKHRELIDLYGSRKSILDDNIDPEIMLLAAMAFKDLKTYEDAISAFLMIKPYNLSLKSKGIYYYALAESYMSEGDKENARKVLEDCSKEKLELPDRQRISLLLADIYRGNGMTEDAYRIYQSVLSEGKQLTNGEIAHAYLSMGEILNNQGNYEEARKILNRCIDLASKDKINDDTLQSAHIELGDVLNKEGKYLYAAKAFERGFNLGYSADKPDYWESRFKFATSYLMAGENAKAEPLLNEIVEQGDTILQQRAQLKLGYLDLEKQLQRLSLNGE